MPIRYYPTADHRMVAVKPWVVPLLREMSDDEQVPMVKVMTDAVQYAYKQRRLGNFHLHNK